MPIRPSGERPKRNRLPRLDTPPNDRQERFALEYVVDFDRVRAVRAAGYEAKDDDAAHVTACRLLKNPKVYAIVLREKARIAEKLKLDAEGTVKWLQLIVMEATADRDWAGAVAALRELGKHYGIYERDNTQKRYNQEDVERLKKELEQRGFNFENVNKPSEN